MQYKAAINGKEENIYIMNIGLMTWFHYKNFGTVLQVTALSSILRSYGNNKDSQNSRIYNILDALNLSNRLYNKNILTCKIDYADVNARLKKLIISSRTFFENTLENI